MKSPVNTPSRIEYLAIGAILALAVLAIFISGTLGLGARAYVGQAAKVYLLPSEKDVFDTWRDLGVEGRIVIHFGQHLPTERLDSGAQRELPFKSQKQFFRSNVTEKNYLYISSRANIIRRIYSVMPEGRWEVVKGGLKKNKEFQGHGEFFTAWMDGLPLRSGTLRSLPKIEEPVMFNFSADYFDQKFFPEALLSALRKERIKADVITFSMPKGDDPEYARKMQVMEQTASLLREL